MDKDHDFYSWINLFDKDKEVINWKIWEEINENYKPYVFYFDQIRWQKSLSYTEFKWYEAYLNNKEDLLYKRYSKNLNSNIQNTVLEWKNLDLKKALEWINNPEIIKAFNSTKKLDTTNFSDISLRYLIDNSTNKFLEIFNKWTISDFRTNVHNAWRYNETTSKVNVDIVSYIVSILDDITDKSLKSTNTLLEWEIDKIVISDLAKEIKIRNKTVTKRKYTHLWKFNESYDEDCSTELEPDKTCTYSRVKNDNTYYYCKNEYVNYLNWKTLDEVNSAKDCSIFRGSSYNSGQLVESNRWLNLEHIKSDVTLCNWKTPKWYYWWSSLIDNLNSDSLNLSNIKLSNYDRKLAIKDLFDIWWSRLSTSTSKNPSPLDCLENNYLPSKLTDWVSNNAWLSNWYSCEIDYELLDSATEWSCDAFNKGNDLYKKGDIIEKTYKNIPSYIIHKSPTSNELSIQLKSNITQNLPIDKTRYIDFFSSIVDSDTWSWKDSYEKIIYPNIFKVTWSNKIDIWKILNELLDTKSKEILNIGWSIDLKSILKNKENKELNIWGEIKKINYYDFLVFSIFWNNLSNISAKYKFVMEYYLSDQIWGNNFKFVLPKNKKIYEIAYMWADWDASNMYVKLDPEDKINSNPYNDIYSKNWLLNSNKISVWVLNWSNKINVDLTSLSGWLSSVNYEEWLFKCAPPEGVPIWEWIPAVMCRLKGLLPVEISVWAWNCGSNDAFDSDSFDSDDVDYYELFEKQKQDQNNSSLNRDFNKNWLNDFCENKIKDNGSIKLYSDSSRYFFNKNWILKTEVLDKNWKRIMLDNSSYITFSLNKIIDKNTWNVIFDKNIDNFEDKKEEIWKYIYFKNFKSKTRYWETKYYFSTKNNESDIYFEANLDLKDSKNNSIKKIKSNQLIIKIRNNRLFLSSKNISDNKTITFWRNVIVNEKNNVYIYDEKNKDLNLENINKNSIVLWLLNIWDNQKSRNINFPLIITLRNKNKKIINKETINNLNTIKGLYNIKKSWSYTIEIVDRYNYKVKTNITVLSWKPKNLKIDLGTNILEKKWAISTNLVSIYDKFNNIIAWKSYDFNLNILGDSVMFNNDSKKLEISTYEWYKAFRVKSIDKTWISKIKIDLFDWENKILTSSKNIKIIDKLNINIKYNNTLEVWNNIYEADLEFVDKNNNIINDLNSRVYMSAWSEYIDLIQPYYKIKDWKSKIKFKTKTLAWKNKHLTFKVEGFNKTINKTIDILPWKAIWLSFNNTKIKLEAKKNNESFINLELKDIYNNVVFTNSNSVIKLEILDKYKNIIWSTNFEKKLHNWVANFKIFTTDLPWKAYLKFSINKKLEENEFIVWKGDKKLIIKWVSENAIMIETFFFYNKGSIIWNKYNSLYTTLLWAEYWDITQKDYLASAMLFDKNNRSLAVTSLLNSPYNKFDALRIWSEWIIEKTFDKSDLTQDITISLKMDLNNNYYLDLFNTAINSYIWKIYLNFETLDVNNDIYNKISNASRIDLKELLGISNFKIYSASNRLKLNNLLENKKNSLIIYIEGSEYKLRDLYSKTNILKSIYYIDPFNTEFSLNSFSNYSLDTYDNFQKNKKLWWWAWNKTLLAFSAWESVWNSTKQYMWVSWINLWDPIISLKKIKKKSYWIDKKFDSTIWMKLNKKEINGYKTFDYNADNLDDILLIEDNWLFSLLENTKTSKWFFRSKTFS